MPRDIRTASSTEQALKILSDRIAAIERTPTPRRVASIMSAAGSQMVFPTTETVGTFVNPTLVSGHRYRVRLVCMASASTAGATGQFRFRYKAGTTADTSGTQVPGALVTPTLSRGAANDNSSCVVEGEFLPTTTDAYLIAFTGKASVGSVTIPSDGTAHLWSLTVDDVS